MTQLVALATAIQERCDALASELSQKTRECEVLYHERNAAMERALKFWVDAKSFRPDYPDNPIGMQSPSFAALRSAVIAIAGSDAEKEKWLAGNGWQCQRDGGWRESPLAGVVPFAIACEIQIRKDLGPFAWLLNNPSGE